MNNSIDIENLKDKRAERREKRKRPRMRVRGRSLKKHSTRAIAHIAKVEKKQKKS